MAEKKSLGQVVERYRALERLSKAESAAEGERTNANAALVKLREKHPDLEDHVRSEDLKQQEAALRQERKAQRTAQAPPPPVPRPYDPPMGPSTFGVSQLKPSGIQGTTGQPGPGSIGSFGRWGRR